MLLLTKNLENLLFDPSSKAGRRTFPFAPSGPFAAAPQHATYVRW